MQLCGAARACCGAGRAWRAVSLPPRSRPPRFMLRPAGRGVCATASRSRGRCGAAESWAIAALSASILPIVTAAAASDAASVRIQQQAAAPLLSPAATRGSIGGALHQSQRPLGRPAAMAGPPQKNRRGGGSSRPFTPQRSGRQGGGGVRKRVAAGPVGDVKLQIGRLKRLLEQVRARSRAAPGRASAARALPRRPGARDPALRRPPGGPRPARPPPAIARPACPRRDAAAPAGRPQGALPPAQGGGARGRARQAGGAAAREEVRRQVPQGEPWLPGGGGGRAGGSCSRARGAALAAAAPPVTRLHCPRRADQVCGPHQD